MRRTTTTIILLFAFAMTVSCDFRVECSGMSDCLEELSTRTISTSGWEESDTILLNDADFLSYYARADELYDDLVGVVESSAAEEAKFMAVLIAQGLDQDRYFEFSSLVLSEYRKGTVPAKLVAYCIFPGASWGTGLVERADDPDVQVFLTLVETSVDEEIVRARLMAVRDGSYQALLDHLRDRGVSVPVVRAKLEDIER